MNQNNESNTQVLKLDNFRNVKKIGLKEIIQRGSRIEWLQMKQMLRKTINEKDPEGKDLYENNKKLWYEIVNFIHDFDVLVSLKQMFESGRLTTIYTQYLANRSDYNGNHGQITMHYADKNAIYPIRLHCLGVKETKNGFVYLRHGGNYSFEHDVVSSLNYFLFGSSEGFILRATPV